MLIVLEGLDGAGKSTQISILKSYLEGRGDRVEYMHFPRFNSPLYGDLISRFLRGDFGSIDSVHPMLVALLFAEDRRAALGIITGWVDEGKHVILDRYVYSNIAFQCAKIEDRGRAKELRDWIINTEFNLFKLPYPNLNLFLDVPIGFVHNKLTQAREGEEREYLNGKEDIHEKDIAFQKRVREVYLSECEHGDGLLRVDCSSLDGEMLPSELIAEKIINFIRQ